jgi:hypothetical protein
MKFGYFIFTVTFAQIIAGKHEPALPVGRIAPAVNNKIRY